MESNWKEALPSMAEKNKCIFYVIDKHSEKRQNGVRV